MGQFFVTLHHAEAKPQIIWDRREYHTQYPGPKVPVNLRDWLVAFEETEDTLIKEALLQQMHPAKPERWSKSSSPIWLCFMLGVTRFDFRDALDTADPEDELS